jgi:hypothetical protein
MTTSNQETYAKKLVAALNMNGFAAKLNNECQEYADTITYSKNGIFGKEILVSSLIKKEWADSVAIGEKEESLEQDMAQCEKEIKYAIEAGATDTSLMSEDDYLAYIYS